MKCSLGSALPHGEARQGSRRGNGDVPGTEVARTLDSTIQPPILILTISL